MRFHRTLVGNKNTIYSLVYSLIEDMELTIDSEGDNNLLVSIINDIEDLNLKGVLPTLEPIEHIIVNKWQTKKKAGK